MKQNVGTEPQTSNASEQEFRQWCIVELMGHVRLAGLVTEEQRFGATVGRVDIPQGDNWVTQYFGGSAIYCVTLTTEEIARADANRSTMRPVVGLLAFHHEPPDDGYRDDEDDEDDDDAA